MTVIGRDRPGLVELVASIVAKHQGNWLESRMCRLGGEFAGILRILVPATAQAALQEELRSLDAQGLAIVACSGKMAPEARPGRMAALELVGQDRPGIVREISRALAGQGVNVEELSTECTSAPMTGETLFRAKARLQLPKSCSVAALRSELERVAGNLLVDVAIDELP
jgi:glycine cleavage system regulatory protein